jgi:hypothetical protein
LLIFDPISGLQLAGQPDSVLKQAAIANLRKNNSQTSALEYWLNPEKKKLTDEVIKLVNDQPSISYTS